MGETPRWFTCRSWGSVGIPTSRFRIRTTSRSRTCCRNSWRRSISTDGARMSRTRSGILAGLFVGALASAFVRRTYANEPALSTKQQQIVLVAAFTADGDMPKLRSALGEGLDAGWTVNELKEVLVQMYAYAGFPRSLNALNTF